MIFRRKLLAVFAITVFLSVTSVAWLTSYFARRSFEQATEKRTATLVDQFRREFTRRGKAVEHRIETIASGDAAARVALSLNQGSPDYGAYLNEAKILADAQQLDFLEFTDDQGTILSSAQWPAKFGYKNAVPQVAQAAFLQRVDTPDGAALGLCTTRQVTIGDKTMFVTGGQRIDRSFVAGLNPPSGMRALLYQNLGSGSDAARVVDSNGPAPETAALARLLEELQKDPQETSALVHWSKNAEGDETVHAIPLVGADHQLLGALLLADSRGPYVDLRQRIRTAALFSGGLGMLLAILLSSWAATRVTRPVEQLAIAARQVAAGDFRAQVPVTTKDELGELAEAFNQMTHELLEQRERLVQSERVAAWRELARRLAHELKNPLFPLQLTVENLLRARQQSPQQFNEIVEESASTLLAEISNLKTIISRFSEFSKMPQPQWQTVSPNELVTNTERVFHAQLQAAGSPAIDCKLELAETMEPIAADPDLLHRALSNLVLNAMDAMPKGGTLTLRTRQEDRRTYIEVSDTGSGLSPEECARLFTPYYTSKTHGTGLGLAIVQSVISDHGGKISVRSTPGSGTTFSIELPPNADKMQAGQVRSTATT